MIAMASRHTIVGGLCSVSNDGELLKVSWALEAWLTDDISKRCDGYDG